MPSQSGRCAAVFVLCQAAQEYERRRIHRADKLSRAAGRFRYGGGICGALSKNIYKNIRKAYNHLKTDGRKMELKVYTRDNLPDNGYLYKLWRMYFIRKLAWNESIPVS